MQKVKSVRIVYCGITYYLQGVAENKTITLFEKVKILLFLSYERWPEDGLKKDRNMLP